jgi:hypothetical protein
VERDLALARGREAADRCLIDRNIVLARRCLPDLRDCVGPPPRAWTMSSNVRWGPSPSARRQAIEGLPPGGPRIAPDPAESSPETATRELNDLPLN